MAHEPLITTPTTDLPLPPVTDGHNTPERQAAMGTTLARAIEEGKRDVPQNPAPLVCKPQELESWRVFKIMAEFVDGFDIIKKYGLAATFFGSARASMDSSVYEAATELAARLAKAGYAVITGGSAGVMEAANKGAFEAGGASIGLNIDLPHEQYLNAFVTDKMSFAHFFVRKVMLAFASEVYIYFPGGFGTLDEFSEILTLVQTKKIRKVPIVLYGKEFWTPLLTVFEEQFLGRYHTIDEADLELYVVVDSVDEAMEYITKTVVC